jgi:hypothetical protein
MLRARRRGLFRREYEVESDRGPLTTLSGTRREGCEFTLDATAYRVERDGRRRFLLHGPDGRVATAERATRREWAVQATSGNLKLVKPSMWRSVWEVHQRGSARGTIQRAGMFSRTVNADVPLDVPLPVGVLALHVVLVHFEREAAAASA